MANATTHAVPQVDIILLGSPGVGKATFISRLPQVQHPSVTRRQQQQAASSNSPGPLRHGPSTDDQTASAAPPIRAGPSRQQSNDSQTTLIATEPHHNEQQPSNESQTTLVPPSIHTPALTGPLSFNVLLFARPYRITIHPSTSPLFIDPFPASPEILILAYAIPSRASLHNLQHYWMPQYHQHYPTSTVPVLLLGLQRDLRTARTTLDAAGNTQYECVTPHEGLQAAREMRLDRYAECSALTGDLMWEATQDITKMAASATVDSGDYASDMCTVL